MFILFYITAGRVHDFSLHVYDDNPVTNPLTLVKLCNFHLGPVLVPDVTLTCGTAVEGQFLRISSQHRIDSNDLLNFCELEVFEGTREVQNTPCKHNCLSEKYYSYVYGFNYIGYTVGEVALICWAWPYIEASLLEGPFRPNVVTATGRSVHIVLYVT